MHACRKSKWFHHHRVRGVGLASARQGGWGKGTPTTASPLEASVNPSPTRSRVSCVRACLRALPPAVPCVALPPLVLAWRVSEREWVRGGRAGARTDLPNDA